MSTLTDIEDQAFLVDLLTQSSEDLKDLLDHLTDGFQERFGEEANPLYLHIQLLSQHLGRAIAQGPLDMRAQLMSEARDQEALVLAHWDEPDEDDPTGLLGMSTKGSA